MGAMARNRLNDLKTDIGWWKESKGSYLPLKLILGWFSYEKYLEITDYEEV